MIIDTNFRHFTIEDLNEYIKLLRRIDMKIINKTEDHDIKININQDDGKIVARIKVSKEEYFDL